MDLKVKDVIDVDHCRIAVRRPNTTNFLAGYEDFGVSLLENTHSVKRVRHDRRNAVQPVEDGLVTPSNTYRNNMLLTTTFNSCSFDDLPEELLLCLFKMLDRRTLINCALVCSKWRRVAYDESLWKCLNIPERRLNIKTLDFLLKRNIKFLSIAYSHIYGDTKYLFETPFTRLQYLDMSAVFLSTRSLSSLLSQCCNLVKLSLEYCRINRKCCEYIARNTNLKVLNLACTTGLNFVGIQHILSLENLEDLNVSWTHINEDNLHYLTGKIMQSLKRVNIGGFLNKFLDLDLISLVYRCPQLMELDISDNLNITSYGLKYTLNNLTDLKVLSINRCYKIDTEFFYSTLLEVNEKNSLCGLKELNLFGINSAQLIEELCALYKFAINKNTNLYIARPKLVNNKHIIWNVPSSIDC